MNTRSAIRGTALFCILSLLFAACTASDADTTTTDDCVADGTCSPGPESGEEVAVSVDGYTVDGTFQGLPVGLTSDGLPFIGEPTAPVTLIEYTDFLCPFCGRHARETAPSLLLRYGNSGDLNFVVHDFPLIALHPTAPAGHTAALCVAEQGAQRFWEYRDLLFRNQAQWSSLPDPSDYLAQSAEAIGAELVAYEECIDSGRTSELVTERVAQANELGFDGTPSFRFVDNASDDRYELVGAQGVDVFIETIDAILAGTQPSTSAVAAGVTSKAVAAEPPSVRIDPDTQDTYNDLTVGFTEDGFPFIGDPEAPISVLEYSDFLCPFCFRHTTQTAPALLEQYATTGEVNFVFRDFPLASLHPTAPVGHQAANCVAEQGAAFYWAYHDILFERQNQWSGLPEPTQYLEQTAEQLGVEIGPYRECMSTGRYVGTVDERVAQGSAAGFNGTPSFQFLVNETGDIYDLVGAYPIETFQEYLDALIAGEEPVDPSEQEQETGDLPFWANEDGLVPDPNRPGYTLAGDAFKGDPDAPIVVIEFSDFQCPSCQRHALEAQPVLDETFVDTGEVMWVFKHFPLSIHPQAPLAAAAAECAGDQGAFFQMESALFESQDVWSIEQPDEVFVGLASDLGLDTEDFSTCLQSRDPIVGVLNDMYDAVGVASETPTFVVIYGGQGRRLEGARSAEEFVRILEAQLESAREEVSEDGS